jgi:hypothetical protein
LEQYILKRRLGKPDLVTLVKIYRGYQPTIADVARRIAATSKLSDQIVYKLYYRLTPEEIAVVEA